VQFGGRVKEDGIGGKRYVYIYACTYRLCDHRAGRWFLFKRTAQRDILTRWVKKTASFSDDDEAVPRIFPIAVSSLTATYSRSVVQKEIVLIICFKAKQYLNIYIIFTYMYICISIHMYIYVYTYMHLYEYICLHK
jgi:hypothetical protein